MCELTSRQRTAALLCQSGARRHQRGRGLSVPVLPPAALSALAENRAGQRCEHYFTALFITAHLRSVTTSSPFECNTSCRADAQMGWIQSLSKTGPEPTCTSSLGNTYLSNTEHSLSSKIMNNVLTLDGLLRTSFSLFFFKKRVECSVKLM